MVIFRTTRPPPPFCDRGGRKQVAPNPTEAVTQTLPTPLCVNQHATFAERPLPHGYFNPSYHASDFADKRGADRPRAIAPATRISGRPCEGAIDPENLHPTAFRQS